MLKKLKNDNQGVVFITVLILILTAMVLAISALSLNISQIKSTENELKYLQAKVLADGGLARILVDQLSASSANVITYTETVGDATFTVTSNIDYSGTGPAGSESVPLDISVGF